MLFLTQNYEKSNKLQLRTFTLLTLISCCVLVLRFSQFCFSSEAVSLLVSAVR